ncbi:MAG: glycosyltransferase family 4 protein [Bacteroidales bacterium]|nr:glycosyltransferase family 4 protein [Bacteroidales bacterium]
MNSPNSTKPTIGVIGLKGLPAFGGAATAGENIINRLKNDFDFVVYAVSSHVKPGFMPGGFRQKVFKSVPLHKLNIFLYYLRSAIHALFAENYALIHLHHIDGAFILPLLRLKYKVISTAHARTFESGKWSAFINIILKGNEQIFLHLSNCVTSVGKPLQETYQGMVKKRIRYIPNGIDVSFLKDVSDIQSRSGYLLFSAGRIIPLKGLHFLINALHRMNSHEKLIVLGDLNQVAQYKSDIEKLSSGLNVEFKGMIRDKTALFDYIRHADLFVFPSISETMSIMLLEVASLNVPIICSDIKANKAVFSEQEVLFFKSESEDDLTEKLNWAMINPAAMQKKSETALHKLKANYDWDKIVVQYCDVYKEFLN